MKKEFLQIGDDAYRILRPLTDTQISQIEASTLRLQAAQLYMHYWKDGLVSSNREDPEWQHIVMYFWKAEEPFPNKSLPGHFENFENKYFVFAGDSSDISLEIAPAIPWFGMPGNGEKHLCLINGEKVTVPELYAKQKVEYIHPVEVDELNAEMLHDIENYIFLIDERISPYYKGNFNLNGYTIPLNIAYSIGGVHLVRKIGLD